MDSGYIHLSKFLTSSGAAFLMKKKNTKIIDCINPFSLQANVVVVVAN